MNKTVLSAKDYERIIYFAAQIMSPIDDVESNIIHELATQFGYNNAILWRTDDDGTIGSPTVYSLSDKTMYNYLDQFKEQDILYPKKHLSIFRKGKVLRISDLLTVEQYENSNYYRSFMKEQGFYDEMSIPLIDDRKLVGFIGLVSEKGQSYFTDLDCKRSLLLAPIISSALRYQHEDDIDCSMLTKREADVVKLLKEGRTNQSIADQLHISINTVKKHLQNIYHRYKVRNRMELIQKLKV